MSPASVRLGHAALVLVTALGTIVAMGQDPTTRSTDAQPGTGVPAPQAAGYLIHPAEITTAMFSPCGEHILTGCTDSTARIWDRATEEELQRFSNHGDEITSVAFSPDAAFVLTGCKDKLARLWDVRSGQQVRCFEGHSRGITSVGFSPDGTQVLTGSLDGTARLWDIRAGEELYRFDGLAAFVAFSPDGRWILTGEGEYPDLLLPATGSRVRFGGSPTQLWSVASGEKVPRPVDGLNLFPGPISSIAISPDGRRFLVGFIAHAESMVPSTAMLRSTANDAAIRHFKGHTAGITSVAFSPTGRQVLTGSQDRTARLWDVATGQELRRLQGHGRAVTAVAFAPTGCWIATGSRDNILRIWALEAEP